jgi:hypothetical protein
VSSSGWWLHLEVRISSSPPILAQVVRLASAEVAWGRGPGGSHGIRSAFVFVGVVSDQFLPIYDCHLWRCSGVLVF